MGKIAERLVNNETHNLSTVMSIFLILASLLLYVLDFNTLWNGYPLETLASGWKYLVVVMAIIFIITFVLNSFTFNLSGSFFLYSLWAFIFVSGIASGNVVSFVHLLFSLIIFFIFKNSATDFELVAKMVFIITFIDFFGFALLRQLFLKLGIQNAAVTSRLMVPLWTYYVLGFCQKHNGTALIDVILIAIAVINLFMILDMGQLTIIQRTDNLDRSWAHMASQRMRKAYVFLTKGMWEGIANSYNNFYQQTFNQSYLYPGQQEQTKNPQGIYIETIDRGDYLFRESSPVYLWAMIRAKTLEKPIENIKINCTTELEDGTVVKGIINEEAEDYVFTDPIYSGMDRTFSCRFDNLKQGSYEAQFNVEFDFSVEARQKIYLMDRTRYTEELVSLKRQGKEPSPEEILRSVGITEISPETIYTTGPVSLGIGTHKSPWDIGDTNNIKYLFGITAENIWPSGKILSINKIQFIVPESFDIFLGSCDASINYNPDIKGGSKIYSAEDKITDIDDFRTVNCLMKVEKDSLDPLKVTTRFLKARLDYTYLMTHKIGFDVQGLSQTEKNIIQKDMVCCEITTLTSTGSDVSYQKLSSYECQNLDDGKYKFTKEADSSKCHEEMYNKCCEISGTSATRYRWVVDDVMCSSYSSETTSARLISETSKCPRICCKITNTDANTVEYVWKKTNDACQKENKAGQSAVKVDNSLC